MYMYIGVYDQRMLLSSWHIIICIYDSWQGTSVKLHVITGLQCQQSNAVSGRFPSSCAAAWLASWQVLGDVTRFHVLLTMPGRERCVVLFPCMIHLRRTKRTKDAHVTSFGRPINAHAKATRPREASLDLAAPRMQRCSRRKLQQNSSFQHPFKKTNFYLYVLHCLATYTCTCTNFNKWNFMIMNKNYQSAVFWFCYFTWLLAESRFFIDSRKTGVISCIAT